MEILKCPKKWCTERVLPLLAQLITEKRMFPCLLNATNLQKKNIPLFSKCTSVDSRFLNALRLRCTGVWNTNSFIVYCFQNYNLYKKKKITHTIIPLPIFVTFNCWIISIFPQMSLYTLQISEKISIRVQRKLYLYQEARTWSVNLQLSTEKKKKKCHK